MIGPKDRPVPSLTDVVHALVGQEVDASLRAANVWTLGMLITALEHSKAIAVRLDNPIGIIPGYLHSYRGYYRMLAINCERGDEYALPTREQMIERLKEADGKTYEGYKGGDFKMDLYTWMWVSVEGHASGLAVVGLDHDETGDIAVIRTDTVNP